MFYFFFLSLYKFYFSFRVLQGVVSIYVCVLCSCALECEKQVSGPLDLEFQAVARHNVGAGGPT